MFCWLSSRPTAGAARCREERSGLDAAATHHEGEATDGRPGRGPAAPNSSVWVSRPVAARPPMPLCRRRCRRRRRVATVAVRCHRCRHRRWPRRRPRQACGRRWCRWRRNRARHSPLKLALIGERPLRAVKSAEASPAGDGDGLGDVAVLEGHRCHAAAGAPVPSTVTVAVAVKTSPRGVRPGGAEAQRRGGGRLHGVGRAAGGPVRPGRPASPSARRRGAAGNRGSGDALGGVTEHEQAPERWEECRTSIVWIHQGPDWISINDSPQYSHQSQKHSYVRNTCETDVSVLRLG